jgi:hypothetical protein
VGNKRTSIRAGSHRVGAWPKSRLLEAGGLLQDSRWRGGLRCLALIALIMPSCSSADRVGGAAGVLPPLNSDSAIVVQHTGDLILFSEQWRAEINGNGRCSLYTLGGESRWTLAETFTVEEEALGAIVMDLGGSQFRKLPSVIGRHVSDGGEAVIARVDAGEWRIVTLLFVSRSEYAEGEVRDSIAGSAQEAECAVGLWSRLVTVLRGHTQIRLSGSGLVW